MHIHHKIIQCFSRVRCVHSHDAISRLPADLPNEHGPSEDDEDEESSSSEEEEESAHEKEEEEDKEKSKSPIKGEENMLPVAPSPSQ